MKTVKHESASDARLYLTNSLVKWKGKIVKVLEVKDDWDVVVFVDNDYKSVPYDELDLTPIKLGYVYSPRQNKTFYIERIPSRQWRQGLTSSNFRDRGGYHISADAREDYFQRLAKQRYPSVIKSLRQAVKTRTKIPFTSNFALDREGIVYYKTKLVGSFDRKKMKFSLLVPYDYLSAELEESVSVYSRHL